MEKITTSEAIESGLTILGGSEDLVLKDKLEQAMTDCGYSFSTENPTACEEAETLLNKFFTDHKRGFPVHITIKKGSIINAIHPKAEQWDYDAEKPVAPCVTYKMPKVDEDAPSRQPIRGRKNSTEKTPPKTVKPNKRQDAESMVGKPRADQKEQWINGTPATTTINNGVNATNNKEENSMNATINNTTNTTAAAQAPVSSAMAQIEATLAAKGVDTAKIQGVKMTLVPAAVAPTVQPTGKTRMVIDTVAINATQSGEWKWYLTYEDADVGQYGRISIAPATVTYRGETKQNPLLFTVEFKEQVGEDENKQPIFEAHPLHNVAKLYFRRPRTDNPDCLYSLNVKMENGQVQNGYAVWKGKYGGVMVYDPTYQYDGKDAQGNAEKKRASHIPMRDKDGNYYARGMAAVLHAAAHDLFEAFGSPNCFAPAAATNNANEE